MAEIYLSLVVVLLPDFQDQVVGPGVLVSDEVELVGVGLAGVPDLIKIRVDTHAPAQHNGIKIKFVDAFLNKHGPFHKIRAHIDSDLFPGILGDSQYGFAQVVAVVGD